LRKYSPRSERKKRAAHCKKRKEEEPSYLLTSRRGWSGAQKMWERLELEQKDPKK